MDNMWVGEPLFGEMRSGNKEGGDDHTKNSEKARS